jgi:hypothetical protein
MADEETPTPPPSAQPPRGQQRKQRAPQGPDPIPQLAGRPGPAQAQPAKLVTPPDGPPPDPAPTRRYLVIETVNLPMGTGMTTLQQGEELSSRQYDIPRLVSLGARLQEIV